MTEAVITTDRHAAALAAARLVKRSSRERRWTRLSLRLGVAIVAIVALLSVCHSLLGLPAPNQQDLSATLQPPSLQHLFGTDQLGRDVLSRTLAAGVLDLAVGISVTGVAILIGLGVGALAGFYEGWFETIVMRMCDVVMAFPFLVLVLGIVAAVGPGLWGVFVGIIAVDWAAYARLTRSEMLVAREQEYILAASTLGFSRRRVLLRHALPNVWRPSLVYSMADIILNISLLATLSYLGLGVRPPTPEWGQIIASGQSVLLSAWWVATLPGVVMVLVGVGFSLVGDSLAEILGIEIKAGE